MFRLAGCVVSRLASQGPQLLQMHANHSPQLLTPNKAFSQTPPPLPSPSAVYHSNPKQRQMWRKVWVTRTSQTKTFEESFVFLSWLEMHFNSLDKNMAILAKSQQMGLQDRFNISPWWLFRLFRVIQDASMTFHTSQWMLQISKG